MIQDFPADWEVHPLGALATPRLGGNYHNTSIPSDRPLIKMGNIARINIDLTQMDYVVPSESVSSAHRLRYGDILFNTRNTLDLVGKVSIWRDEPPIAYYNSNILRLEFRNDYREGSSFFGYALNSRVSIDAIRALATGTTSVAAVYTRDLLKLEVPVPPKAERLAIVAVLSDSDALISALEGQIAKKEAIRQGMMQQLLTGETRLPGFTGAWSTYKLKQLGPFLKGRGIKRDDVQPSGVACIRYGELYTAYRDYTSTTVSFVNQSVASTALRLRRGDLLFAGSGETRDEIGMCAAFTGTQPAVAGGDIIVLRASNVNPVYLASIVNSPKVMAQKARLGQGDAVVHISSRALGSIELDLPPRDEQDAIAQVLVDADAEIRVLKARLSKAKAIKQGMMQQLLTGRTRLPIMDEVPA